MQGQRVVVTGGTGLTGSFLVERLVAEGANVRVPFRENHGVLLSSSDRIEWVQGDITDASFCSALLSDADALFHLASHRKNVAYHREKHDEVIAQNVAMTEALITGFSRDIPVTFFSTAIAGVVEAEHASVDDIPDGYTAGKILCEQRWQEVTDPLIVRPVSIYGPRDYFGVDSNVIPALIVKAAEATDTLEAWGSGAQERSFVYVEDVVGSTLALRKADETGIHYLSPPTAVTIRELAEMIRDLVHPELAIHFDTSKPEGPTLTSFPCSDALKDYPWTPLAKGLQQTVEWWRQSL